MPFKSTLVLCDTGVIIEAFRTNSWNALVTQYKVVVSQAIVDEALWYTDSAGKHQIDLSDQISSGSIVVVDPPASSLAAFKAKYNSSYSERLHAGELSLLFYLFEQPAEGVCICSGDAVVYNVLGKELRSTQGVSLEELLSGLGLSRQLRFMFKRDFKEKCLADGLLGFSF